MKKDSETLFSSMKKGLGKFYKEAKEEKRSHASRLQGDLDKISYLRTEDERYIKTRVQAEGGMKTIIRASDKLTCRQIAMAKIKEQDFSSKDLKMFLHEARILARLDHPNIVPLYDIGVDTQDQPYFTMKLLSGESLGSIIEKLKNSDEIYAKKFSLNRLLEIFLKVCDAVAFAHSRNIVHRDLKPDNIQVSKFGEVLLCDWGLAKDINLPNQSTEEIKISEIIEKQTMSGTIKGTPGYMAPEQIDDNLNEISEQTDIYALGGILYTILTLENPLNCHDIESLKEKTLNGDIIPPTQRTSRTIPVALEAVCQKAMMTDPQLRYTCPEAIIQEIKAYIDGFATDAQNADFKTQVILLIKRHKNTSLLIAASFAVILSIILFFLIELKERESVALNAMKEAQYQKLEKDKLSSMAAPEFHKKAIEDFKLYQFESSLQYAKLSTDLDPSLSSAWELLAKLQLGAHQYEFALTSLSKTKLKNKDDIIKLCKTLILQKDSAKLPIETIKSLKKNELHAIIPFYIKNHYNKLTTQAAIHQSKALFSHFSNHSNLMSITQNTESLGLIIAPAKKARVNNLDLFHGLPFTDINIAGSTINDIRALNGMPLKSLNISHSTIDNLNIINQYKLENLNISRNPIADISAIRNMPLKSLNISRTKIKSLAALLELPALEKLIIDKRVMLRKDIISILKARGVLVEISNP